MKVHALLHLKLHRRRSAWSWCRWCKWLRLLWCDAAGVRRCRIIPAARIRDIAQRGLGLTQGCMAATVFSDSPVPATGLSADGETNIVPDLSTLKQVPWRESHYITHVDMRTASGKSDCQDALRVATLNTQTSEGVLWFRSPMGLAFAGEPWEYCPRSALRRTLMALESEFGITMKVNGCAEEAAASLKSTSCTIVPLVLAHPATVQ
jgi:glutamine synthetase